MTWANPRGSDGEKSIYEQSQIFDSLVGNVIGSPMRSRATITSSKLNWKNILPEEMKGFSGIIHSLSRYLFLPWNGMEVPPPHRFHAHNFLQRLLFQEIEQLNNKDPIELELVPLPVISQLGLTQLTSHLKSSLPSESLKRPPPEDNGGVMHGKRRKHHHSQADDGDVCLYIHLHYVINLYQIVHPPLRTTVRERCSLYGDIVSLFYSRTQ
jgi:hypothetical protein